MDFVPDTDQGPTIDVPYYGEARAEDGWQGQGTTRSFDALKSEITQAMSRLGGVVHGFQRGTYMLGKLERAGVQVHYSVEGPDGKMIYGRLDVAALPVQKPAQRINWKETMRRRMEASLSMALYNVAQALKAQWVLKQLNPSYMPLMPWLFGKGDKTLSEIYLDRGYLKALMPPKAGDFIEGDFKDKTK
jgi:hypothetical protein